MWPPKNLAWSLSSVACIRDLPLWHAWCQWCNTESLCGDIWWPHWWVLYTEWVDKYLYPLTAIRRFKSSHTSDMVQWMPNRVYLSVFIIMSHTWKLIEHLLAAVGISFLLWYSRIPVKNHSSRKVSSGSLVW